MRVTNSMIQNQMMVNINRNLTKINTLYNQQATGKRVIVPSDDPIAASRALTLRSGVAETEQYRKNVDQASSWMEVTEQAYGNVLDVMTRIRELCVQGASDTLSTEDRKKIATDINSLTEQLGVEMNASYAGRYVFSGYRTDEEAVFTENDASASYEIIQQFSDDNIREVEKYQKLAGDDEGKITSCDIINLAYDDIENVSIGSIDANGNFVADPSITIEEKSISDLDAYEPGDDDAYYIKETGELVIGSNVKESIKTSDLAIKYDKTGFSKGDLNPKVYFNCTDKNTGAQYDMNGHNNMEYEVGVGNRVSVNSLAKDVLTDNIQGDLTTAINDILNMEKSSETALRLKYEAQGYTGEDLDKKIEEQLQKEEALMSAAALDSFSDLIEVCDNSLNSISIQHTDLGARMNRLDLIKIRLEDEETTYTDLLSETEDVDYVQNIMDLTSAEVIYQASLKSGTSIIQTSLVDFI